ncbi:uncharacterized oxidoreductase YtbE-like [Oppia nitens]|uniref:uncharacterized oxidoreductase YtbE-like n=1 Tax=Oppia nitens TaxID=1686743 RepID=UPI0023DCB1AA|nr:uncharacterized oxidoreductase YtbE-like [Oppia nitens]
MQEVFAEKNLTRKDIYLVYKVWPKNSNYRRTQNAIRNALLALNTTYLDLVSIKWPLKDNSDIYRALEWAREQGMARSIGVSNFKPAEIETLMTKAVIKPSVNHIRIHPGFNQDETVDYCQKQGIVVAGWSPLGTGSMIKDPTLVAMGQRYNKSAAQVMIRWQLQRGLVVVPKSTKLKRIIENFSVFDFKLNDKDMEIIHSMPQINLIDFWG